MNFQVSFMFALDTKIQSEVNLKSVYQTLN